MAATAYLAAANAAKTANTSLDKQYSGTLTFAQARAYYRAAGAIDATFLLAVKAISFPSSASGDAAALISQVMADEALDQQVAGSQTSSQAEAITKGRPDDLKAVAAAGNQLRVDLGLPTVQ